jgi:hypothetical protein
VANKWVEISKRDRRVDLVHGRREAWSSGGMVPVRRAPRCMEPVQRSSVSASRERFCCLILQLEYVPFFLRRRLVAGMGNFLMASELLRL